MNAYMWVHMYVHNMYVLHSEVLSWKKTLIFLFEGQPVKFFRQKISPKEICYTVCQLKESCCHSNIPSVSRMSAAVDKYLLRRRRSRMWGRRVRRDWDWWAAWLAFSTRTHACCTFLLLLCLTRHPRHVAWIRVTARWSFWARSLACGYVRGTLIIEVHSNEFHFHSWVKSTDLLTILLPSVLLSNAWQFLYCH